MEFVPALCESVREKIFRCLPPWGADCMGSGHGCVTSVTLLWKGVQQLVRDSSVFALEPQGKSGPGEGDGFSYIPAMPVHGQVPHWWTQSSDFAFQLDLIMPCCCGFVRWSLSQWLNQVTITSLELLLLFRCHGTAHLLFGETAAPCLLWCHLGLPTVLCLGSCSLLHLPGNRHKAILLVRQATWLCL